MFIADLTYVAISPKGDGLPNPKLTAPDIDDASQVGPLLEQVNVFSPW